MKSILRPWVSNLGLRHQGTLLTSIRGCDGVQKHDPSKPVMRAIRYILLTPFDERELYEKKGFMYFCYESFSAYVCEFAKNSDEYPSHFIWHAIHALEIIGYKHPDERIREIFHAAYVTMINKFHVNPESASQMEERLTEDRIALGTVAG